MFRKVLAAFMSIVMLLMAGCSVQPNGGDVAKFLFPSEEEKHEGTWLTCLTSMLTNKPIILVRKA